MCTTHLLGARELDRVDSELDRCGRRDATAEHVAAVVASACSIGSGECVIHAGHGWNARAPRVYQVRAASVAHRVRGAAPPRASTRGACGAPRSAVRASRSSLRRSWDAAERGFGRRFVVCGGGGGPADKRPSSAQALPARGVPERSRYSVSGAPASSFLHVVPQRAPLPLLWDDVAGELRRAGASDESS